MRQFLRKSLYTQVNYNKRIYGLDIMRAIAIALVLVSHGKGIFEPFYGSADSMRLGGFLGVELFFVLSGFLIGGILIKVFEKESEFDNKVMGNFWIRRWFRTLPNYYFVLAIHIIMTLVFTGAFDREYLSFFAFLQNFHQPQAGLFPEAWSLAVEEWFYLMLPTALFVINRITKPLGYSKQKRFFITIMMLTLGITALRVLYVVWKDPNWDWGLRRIVIYRLDAIMYGVIAAYFHHYFKSKWTEWKRPLFILGSIMTCAAMVLYFYDMKSESPTVLGRILLFPWLSISFAMMLPAANSIRAGKGFLHRFITHTSIISYSLYLFHYSILLHLMQMVIVPSNVFEASILYTLYWSVAFIVSTIVYNLLEVPVMKLRDKFSSHGPVKPVPKSQPVMQVEDKITV